MANFSAAFGYDFFIVPVQNTLIADFSVAPTVDTATPVDPAHTVAYSNGVFTVNSVPFAICLLYTSDAADE